MHNVLARAHAQADHQRMQNLLHQTEPTTSRLEDLHKWCFPEGLFHNALQQSATNLVDPTFWSHMESTEETALNIFCAVLRPASVQWDLVIQKCTQYPYKLFELITSPEAANRALDESLQRPCMLDPLAKDFFFKYDTVEKVQSSEAQEVLRVLSCQVMGHTWTTERLHSSHSRRTRTRFKHTACNFHIWLFGIRVEQHQLGHQQKRMQGLTHQIRPPKRAPQPFPKTWVWGEK